jgi:hypothetical protein
MKNIIHYTLSVFLIALLINSAYGFPGMGGNNSTVNTGNNIKLINSTSSDLNIQLIQHLIEVDTVQSVNGIYIHETLIFKNTGNQNFSGRLRTWVQDNAQDIKIGKTEMMAEALPVSMEFNQDTNNISWNDSIEINDPLLPLYIVDYFIPETNATLTGTKYFTKQLVYPVYNYRQDLPAIMLKVTKSNDSSVTLKDEIMNKIEVQGVTEGNSILFRFSNPQFKELNVEISKTPLAGSSSSSGIVMYVILGILILMVVSYPILRKKSEKLQAFEDKIKNSLKKEPGTGEEPSEGTVEGTAEKEQIEEVSDDEDISGMANDKLEKEKNDLISKRNKLEKDYSAGDLLDEEYEELKSSYKIRIGKINARLKQSK